MISGAPDEETAKMTKAAYKTVILQMKIEARKTRERTERMLEVFNLVFGGGVDPKPIYTPINIVMRSLRPDLA